MITLFFFARLAEAAKVRSLQRPPAPTARALVDRCSQLEFLRDRSIRVAVNRQWAHWDTPLSDGDEVAFLPPSSVF